MTLDEWVASVAAELGVETFDSTAVLDLARDVAHGVARRRLRSPVCWSDLPSAPASRSGPSSPGCRPSSRLSTNPTVRRRNPILRSFGV